MFKAAQSKKEQENDKEKTLDLLDELLYSIHSTRANVLMARARKYEKRLAKRKEKVKMSSRRNRGSFINETDVDADVDNIIDEMAEEFGAATYVAPVARQRPSRGAKAGTGSNDALASLSVGKAALLSEDEDGEGEGEGYDLPPPKETAAGGKKKKVELKPTKLFQSHPQAFHSNADRQADMMVVQICADFRSAIEKFLLDPAKRNSSDARGEMADYLTDQFLSKKLDPLPPSKTTSTYRKLMSKIIDDLGSAAGMLPADWRER
jgi:hypothetical protein